MNSKIARLLDAVEKMSKVDRALFHEHFINRQDLASCAKKLQIDAGEASSRMDGMLRSLRTA